MSYRHKGKILENGSVAFEDVGEYPQDLTVMPEDDGMHVKDFNKGDFEWWYFDLVDRTTGSFLKIVMHIGTDALRTSVNPQLAVSVNTTGMDENPSIRESFTRSYRVSDLEADTRQCRIRVKDEINIFSEGDHSEPKDRLRFFINIDVPGFSCRFVFTSVLEGWKPLGKEVSYQMGKKQGAFSWIIPVPRAVVEGDFTFCRPPRPAVDLPFSTIYPPTTPPLRARVRSFAPDDPDRKATDLLLR